MSDSVEDEGGDVKHTVQDMVEADDRDAEEVGGDEQSI